MSNNMEVWEIFQSVQGEGFYTGHWATFLRLCGCPVGCDFCDTRETWDKGRLGYQNKAMSIHDVYDAVVLTKPSLLVITGGEPLLQASAVQELTEALIRTCLSLKIQIETSGVVPLTNSFLSFFAKQTELGRLHITCSPKSRHQFDTTYLSIIKEFKFLADCDGHVIIPKDVNIEDLWRRKKTHIMVQPIDYSDAKQTAEAAANALRFVSTYPEFARLSLQTHKYIGVK